MRKQDLSIFIALCFALFGCVRPLPGVSSTPIEDTTQEQKYQLRFLVDSLSLMEDDVVSLTVETDAPSVSYRSLDSNVVEVSSGGVLIALKPGTAKVEARAGLSLATLEVTVASFLETAERIDLPSNHMKVLLGEEAFIEPKHYTKKDGVEELDPSPSFIFSSSDDGIAGIEDNGRFVLKRSGKSTISIKAGKASANVVVDVFDRGIKTTNDWRKMIEKEKTPEFDIRYLVQSDLDFSEVMYEGLPSTYKGYEGREFLASEVDGDRHTLTNISFPNTDDGQIHSLLGMLCGAYVHDIAFSNVSFNEKHDSYGLAGYLAKHYKNDFSSTGQNVTVPRTHLENIILDAKFEGDRFGGMFMNVYGGSAKNIFVRMRSNKFGIEAEGKRSAIVQNNYSWYGSSMENTVVASSGSPYSLPKMIYDSYPAGWNENGCVTTNHWMEAVMEGSNLFPPSCFHFTPNKMPTFVS